MSADLIKPTVNAFYRNKNKVTSSGTPLKVSAATIAAIDEAIGYVYSSDPEEDEDKDNSSTLVGGDAE
ncbi:hypothetical protein AC578_6292 [Pseudocercospora eumusae]|uniref:Uncharacterized protein n=1 Tax=Pseudocercospora eumusae TaxID=321146 RepID=A0A139H714_9PEZI|nr:hypothetical protein AC578_6292 [Pseudocercospora eumusae]